MILAPHDHLHIKQIRARRRAERPNLRASTGDRRGVASRPERLGARLFGALRTVDNPDHGGADSGEVVFYASPALGVKFRFCRCQVGCVAERPAALRAALAATYPDTGPSAHLPGGISNGGEVADT
jgi:hypothetical protein